MTARGLTVSGQQGGGGGGTPSEGSSLPRPAGTLPDANATGANANVDGNAKSDRSFLRFPEKKLTS